ncbi:MAG: sterol desaturase family protein [Gammaproteobacteria bacterium]|nr:MAG: sterol desaturase family protein [Gammaproteobacteria bacterium]
MLSDCPCQVSRLGQETAIAETVLTGATAIRLGCFLGVFAVIALWEVWWPRRQLGVSRWARWPDNLGIVVLNSALQRILIPTTLVGLALVAEQQGWGLLNLRPMPEWFVIVLAVMILDFAIYLQHVLFHAVPVLWRLHRMHHADLDFDVTTGARFHPIEILLSAGVKLTVVAAIGAPAVAVLIFEVLLNATSLFNHGNIRIPLKVDRLLRWIIVTPDMHRVHHSIVPHETNSNFGFNVPFWDRLFGTYRAQPAAGHDDMTIGIEQFRSPRELRLDRMLVQPFRGTLGDYPINRETR